MQNMQRITAIDSVVLQAISGNANLRTAKKIEVVLGGVIEVIKCFPIKPTNEHRKAWRNVTGRPFPTAASFIALLHHERGQAIPIIRYGNGKGLEIHFHGLQQYQRNEFVLTDGSIQRRAILDEFLALWDEPIKLSCFDRSIDLIGVKWHDYTNTRDHRKLCKRQGASTYKKTTIYYQPPKPKYVKVMAYDKQGAKDKLGYPLVRIEYSFKSQYWRNDEAMSADEVIKMATLKADAYIKRLSR